MLSVKGSWHCFDILGLIVFASKNTHERYNHIVLNEDFVLLALDIALSALVVVFASRLLAFARDTHRYMIQCAVITLDFS